MSLKTRGYANVYFCYICGSFVAKAQRQNVTKSVQNVYYAYFGIKLGDQDKTWSPHKVCHSCVKSLCRWSNGKQKVWHLTSRLCGESQRHMEMNAISAVAMFLDSMQKINITFLTLIYHLRFDPSLMDQISLYQHHLQY